MEVSLEQISISPNSSFCPVSESQLVRAKRYSISKPKQETCGAFCFKAGELFFIACENKSPYSVYHFNMDLKFLIDNDVRYIYHSHIGDNPAYPSKLDKLVSDELSIPFIIYSLSRDSFFVYDNISV